MNWLTTLASPITAIVKGVSGFVSKKQEITANKEKAIAKLKQSKQEGQQHIILTIMIIIMFMVMLLMLMMRMMEMVMLMIMIDDNSDDHNNNLI